MMSSVLCKLKTRRTETAQIKNSYWSFALHIFLRNNSDLLSTNSLHSSLSSWVCWLISGSNTRTLFSSSKWNPAGPSAIFDRPSTVSQKALRLTNCRKKRRDAKFFNRRGKFRILSANPTKRHDNLQFRPKLVTFLSVHSNCCVLPPPLNIYTVDCNRL